VPIPPATPCVELPKEYVELVPGNANAKETSVPNIRQMTIAIPVFLPVVILLFGKAS
jgi:hypothetical protein